MLCNFLNAVFYFVFKNLKYYQNKIYLSRFLTYFHDDLKKRSLTSALILIFAQILNK